LPVSIKAPKRYRLGAFVFPPSTNSDQVYNPTLFSKRIADHPLRTTNPESQQTRHRANTRDTQQDLNAANGTFLSGYIFTRLHVVSELLKLAKLSSLLPEVTLDKSFSPPANSFC